MTTGKRSLKVLQAIKSEVCWSTGEGHCGWVVLMADLTCSMNGTNFFFTTRMIRTTSPVYRNELSPRCTKTCREICGSVHIAEGSTYSCHPPKSLPSSGSDAMKTV